MTVRFDIDQRAQKHLNSRPMMRVEESLSNHVQIPYNKFPSGVGLPNIPRAEAGKVIRYQWVVDINVGNYSYFVYPQKSSNQS